MRIKELQKQLQHWNVEALLIENPIDLFYLTGLDLSKGRLYLTSGESKLFVDGRYLAYASLHAPCPVDSWENLKWKGQVGIDSGWMTVDACKKLEKESGSHVKPIYKPLLRQRSIKEKGEIQKLRKAAEVTWQGVQHILRFLKEGVSEQELALEFEFFVRKHGASGLSFQPIIAFGANSALPHHRASLERLKPNQIVLIDVGAIVDHYCGDMTRVFFFGEPDPRLQRMFDLVREAYDAAARRARIGEAVGSLDRAARDRFVEAGKERLFVHSLGHGVGLETHEYPMIRWDGDHCKEVICEGMVFTIEPGLYDPGLGGIRYENTGVVTDLGFESFYPEESRHALP